MTDCLFDVNCSLTLSKLIMLVVQISEAVLPDGLHPNAEGMSRLASCLSPAISRYVKPHLKASHGTA